MCARSGEADLQKRTAQVGAREVHAAQGRPPVRLPAAVRLSALPDIARQAPPCPALLSLPRPTCAFLRKHCCSTSLITKLRERQEDSKGMARRCG